MPDTTPTLTDEQREELVEAVFTAIERQPCAMTETGALKVYELPRCYATPMAERAADALAPLIARMVADAERRAWDEGRQALAEQMGDVAGLRNPYRAARIGGTV